LCVGRPVSIVLAEHDRGVLSLLSSLSFRALHVRDGESVSKGSAAAPG
jgi:hypothetical protein